MNLYLEVLAEAMSQTITPNPELASSPPLAGERVAVTGVLASMTHRKAHELVEQLGGEASEHVSRQTTMLVVGEEGWPLEDDGQPSVKFEQAQRLQQAGLPLRIVGESDWLRFLGLRPPGEEPRSQYTPAMLSQMLGVPVSSIRQWERSGLIRPVRRIYRLPYFDFQEAASARRLTDLLAAGVSRRQIETSLRALGSVLKDVSQPLSQLEILGSTRELGYRDEEGRLKTIQGQRLFDFERVDDTSADQPASVKLPPSAAPASPAGFFEEACRLADVGDFPAAVEHFRQLLRLRPMDAEIRFQLAETLYRRGNLPAAYEQYRTAAEIEPEYVEAWTQLGCVAAEQHDLPAAAEAFRTALSVHPNYPDAHFHLAQVLAELGRPEEAAPHWRQYLQFDDSGPWAAAARERLGESGPDSA